MEIRALREDDDRSLFRSGDPDLDRFFQQFAGQNQFRHHLGVTYVAVDARHILGFATVAAAHVEIEGLPAAARKKLPRYPLPVLRLARLGVDQQAQGQGLGVQLLRVVLQLAAADGRRLWMRGRRRRCEAGRRSVLREVRVAWTVDAVEGGIGRAAGTDGQFRSIRAIKGAVEPGAARRRPD